MAHLKLKKGQARQKLVRDHFQEVSVELSLKAIFEQVLIKINLNKSVQTPIKGEAMIKECKSFHMLMMKVNKLKYLMSQYIAGMTQGRNVDGKRIIKVKKLG